MTKQSRITPFLGTYAKDYGHYYYALILSISEEDGLLHYNAGNDRHDGWMVDVYTDYSISGNELRANRMITGTNGSEIGTDIFVLNENGSIAATFSDIDFNNGVYEASDESIFESEESYP